MEETDLKENTSETEEQEKDKKPLITFAKLNKYFLIPFLCPIFCMSTNFLIRELSNSNITKRLEFIGLIYVELSYFAGGLFHFVSKFLTKSNKIKERVSSNGIKYIYSDKKNYKSSRALMLIILLSFLMGISEFVGLFTMGKHLFEFRLYFLFFIPLFSKLILRENIYKHQYLSLIIAAAGIIFLFVPVCLVLDSCDIVPNILNLVSGFSYSLFLVVIKYMTQKYYISPFKLSLIFGILSIIFTCIIFIFFSLIKYHDLSYFNNIIDFSEVKNKEIIIYLYLILCFLSATTLRVFTLLAIFYFSPTLIIVTDIISPMLLWVVLTIQNCDSIITAIINPIGYVIVLFSSLIYNEIIIFNFWGLSHNTKKFVDQRVSTEIKQIEDALLSENSQNNDDDSINSK